MKNSTLPLVYSCSGCSSAGQAANDLAIDLHRGGLAEMSCIAGVGAGIPPFVKTARSGRPILCIDGCRFRCASACLKNAGVIPRWHFILTDMGIEKIQHGECKPSDLMSLMDKLRSLVREADSNVA